MAIFRKISVGFWEDSLVYSLTAEQKYFFLYLLTNSKTKQCGVYEITLGKMCVETGYTLKKVEVLLKFFCENGRIKYSRSTSEIAIRNWLKYNDSSSPKVKACVRYESVNIKDRSLLSYVGVHVDQEDIP